MAEDPRAEIARLNEEVARLRGLLNNPEYDNFLQGVRREAGHQIARWGTVEDRAKAPADWFWLLAYLSGKALMAVMAGDVQKAKHHCISSAAVLFNWHCAISGTDNRFTPGDSDLQKFVEERFGDMDQPVTPIVPRRIKRLGIVGTTEPGQFEQPEVLTYPDALAAAEVGERLRLPGDTRIVKTSDYGDGPKYVIQFPDGRLLKGWVTED